MVLIKKWTVVYSGGFKEYFKLFLPILLMTFSNYLSLFLEKLMLTHYSIKAMEAAIYTAYLCQIFQISCIALAMMAQVLVGRWMGEKNYKIIGPGIWQFIWFSFFSLLITIPLNFLYGEFYFRNNELRELATPYFYFFVFANFIYPLNTSLACFYLGQGKSLLIFFGSLFSQCLKLILTYFLIFGFYNIIPSLGLLGAALSTFIAQISFCCLLFYFFLKKEQAAFFNTRDWFFRPSLFFSYTRPGALRALNRILTTTSWAAIVILLNSKGSEYSLCLALGGILFHFLSLFGEAICQTQVTIVSNLLGSMQYHLLNKALKHCNLLALVLILILSLPFVFFPLQTFQLLFEEVELAETSIRHLFFGVWASFSIFIFSFIPVSYVLAFKDMSFSLFMGFFNWINGYALMYVFIRFFDLPADQFWLSLVLLHGSNGLIYLFRARHLLSTLATTKIAARQG